MRRARVGIGVLASTFVACKSPAPPPEIADASRASSPPAQSSLPSPLPSSPAAEPSSYSSPPSLRQNADGGASRAYMNARSIVSSAPIANAERTVTTALRPHALACYTNGLRDDPDMAGTVTITIELSPAGEVKGTNVFSNVGLSANVAKCVAEVARHPLFDPTANGTTLTVALQFGVGK